MKILVPVDGSASSLDAVGFLVEHAGWYRDKLFVDLVFVQPPLPTRLPHMALTQEVATFIVQTPSAAIPPSVRKLGIRSILDGVGLALAGEAAESGHLVREYLADLACAAGPSTRSSSAIIRACRIWSLP